MGGAAGEGAVQRVFDGEFEDGPQLVTRRGVEAAVLVPIGEWRRLQQTVRPSLKELLLASEPRFPDGIAVPARGLLRRRTVRPLD